MKEGRVSDVFEERLNLVLLPITLFNKVLKEEREEDGKPVDVSREEYELHLFRKSYTKCINLIMKSSVDVVNEEREEIEVWARRDERNKVVKYLEDWCKNNLIISNSTSHAQFLIALHRIEKEAGGKT